MTRATGMFINATRFNSDLSVWDVSAATDIGNMFSAQYGATMNFTAMGLAAWNVTNVVGGDFVFWLADGSTNPIEACTRSAIYQSWGQQNQQFGSGGTWLWAWASDPLCNPPSAPPPPSQPSPPSAPSPPGAPPAPPRSPLTSLEVAIEAWISDPTAAIHNYGPIAGWDVSSVTDNYEELFLDETDFNGDLDGWDVSSVTRMDYMFKAAWAFNSDLNGWNVSASISNMFSDTHAFNSDLNGWAASGYTLEQIFYQADEFNSDLNSWDVSGVHDLSNFISDAKKFNNDISDWDVSRVRSLNHAFSNMGPESGACPVPTGTRGFTGNAGSGIGAWDVSSVTNMQRMIQESRMFDVDLGAWDVGSVADMQRAFHECCTFEARGLSGWDVGNVESADEVLDSVPSAVPSCTAAAIRESWVISQEKADPFKNALPAAWADLASCAPAPPPPLPPFAPLRNVTDGEVTNALLAARGDSQDGLPVAIQIPSGTHLLDEPLVFNASWCLVSQVLPGAVCRVDLTGMGADSATLRAPTGADGVLLTIASGAPEVHLSGMSLDGQISFAGDAALYLDSCQFVGSAASITGRRLATELETYSLPALYIGAAATGRVELRGALFEGLPAGALHVAGGVVTVLDSTLKNNVAARGAAAHVTGGRLTFVRCNITGNNATEAGGALAIDAGSVLLANQTLLHGNIAPSGALAALNVNGSLAYGLPAPRGYWIEDSAVCEVTDCDTAPCAQHTDAPDDFTRDVSIVTKFEADSESLDEDPYPLECPCALPPENPCSRRPLDLSCVLAGRAASAVRSSLPNRSAPRARAVAQRALTARRQRPTPKPVQLAPFARRARRHQPSARGAPSQLLKASRAPTHATRARWATSVALAPS